MSLLHVNVVVVLLLLWSDQCWTKFDLLSIGFHLRLYRWASIALSWLLQLLRMWNAISWWFILNYHNLVITVTRCIHCDLPVCIIVFIQWCIGMRNCADVLQMTTTLPPRSRRQSCPRRSMFEVHLRLKGLSVFLICFFLSSAHTSPLTSNVLRP